MRIKISRWLNLPDIYKEMNGLSNRIGDQALGLDRIEKELSRETTTAYGDRLNRAVEKLQEELYAIKAHLEVEVVYEDREDNAWAQMNKRYIRVPVVRKKAKK